MYNGRLHPFQMAMEVNSIHTHTAKTLTFRHGRTLNLSDGDLNF